MSRPNNWKLSRRERQIMDIVYRLQKATAAQIMEAMPDPPTISAVRAMLRILEAKGQLKHEDDGLRYTFSPVISRERARVGALKQLIETFFDGSTGDALAALITENEGALSKDEVERIQKLLAKAKREGR